MQSGQLLRWLRPIESDYGDPKEPLRSAKQCHLRRVLKQEDFRIELYTR